MKTWFITGASRGFGGRIAEKALARGDAVVATARKPQSVIDRLGQNDKLLAVALDVNDPEQAEAAAAQAYARFGRIDILVNNAGYGMVSAVEEASAEEVEALFRTNVFGLLAVTRAILPLMRAQRSGRILNFSSVGGYRAGPGFGIYSATKFAVEALSESLRIELDPLGIGVTVIEPGYFRTDFLEASSLRFGQKVIADYAATAGAVRERAVAMNQNQPGDPDRLSQVLLDLADAMEPPVRLPLGSDAIAAMEAKHRSDAAIIAAWRHVSVSTDFPTPWLQPATAIPPLPLEDRQLDLHYPWSKDLDRPIRCHRSACPLCPRGRPSQSRGDGGCLSSGRDGGDLLQRSRRSDQTG